ncbi:FKBP-type peptidyl-prolyl cis-trans isomerase [Thiohalobacter sp.]|uniref:FKBP-type peptidyl-prolyl cis-trans isomerase n=1 Tax=Thiohalobacter sp. TaxID=2025948 RepID=UPI002624A2E3|nr:peptidylprolyl isomerase [Thiohalobacter sp.]
MDNPSEKIADGKYVELKYQVLDQKTGSALTRVDYPIGYVHGVNDILAEDVMDVLEGHKAGDVVEVPIDGKAIFGPRDESLVFSDRVENVPKAYREVGTTIVAENEKGDTRKFIVTRNQGGIVTFDGNHPLCGRDLIFRLEICTVRDATEEEVEAGGAVESNPEIEKLLKSAVEVPRS